MKKEEIINRFIGLYKKDTNRWENERFSHYDFFKLLFDFLIPKKLERNLNGNIQENKEHLDERN